MIEILKSYDNYKQSGSQWLGAVPAHWEVRNLRTLITKRAERNRSDLPLLSVAREKGVYVRSLTDDNHNVIPEDLTNYKVAREGDLVINKMKAWQGSMGISPCDGIVSPAYYVFKFGIKNSMYGQALLRSKPYVSHFGQASDGVRIGQWDLSIPGMRQIPILIPTEEEQNAIVRFLAHANIRIEQATKAKRKIISFLKEQKEAVIHFAVVRGIDPSVSFKSSGISWFGDIPAHWEMRQVRHMGRLLKGTGGTKDDAVSQGIPCVRYGELYSAYNNFIRQTRTYVSPERAINYTSIQYGDVLFAASGEKIEEIGKSAVNLIKGTAVCGGDIVILRPNISVHAPFLGYALDAYGAAYHKATMCRGTTIKHVYPDELRSLQVPFPPVEEQEKITLFLDDDLAQLNKTISRLEHEIELLREYRFRLVADIVTGKLDVREASKTLPEPTQELSEDNSDMIEEDEQDLAA